MQPVIDVGCRVGLHLAVGALKVPVIRAISTGVFKMRHSESDVYFETCRNRYT